MSVTTPEDLARNIASDGVACTDTDVANRLLTHLRHAQAMGSPDSPEPLEVFARAGGVAALAAAMKANTPVAADWPEGTRPASGIDLAMVQKEGCGVLNNIAASALAGGAATASALREAALLPLLVSTVDAYAQRPDVMHRVLPALAQLVALMPKDGSGVMPKDGSGGLAVEADEGKRTEAEELRRMVAAVVRCMQASAAEDAWIQCSGAPNPNPDPNPNPNPNPAPTPTPTPTLTPPPALTLTLTLTRCARPAHHDAPRRGGAT